MLNMAHHRIPLISRRISLRFLPNPPEEHTSTIVLNGGGFSNIYTDFRPYLSDPHSCEWILAGVKEYLSDGRCSWTNLINSRSENNEEAPADIGHNETLPNGDILETGEMLNPTTGNIEPYEEIWRDDPIERGTKVVVLTLNDVGRPQHGIFVQVGALAQGVFRSVSGICAVRWEFKGEWEMTASHGAAENRLLPKPVGSCLAETMIEPAEVDGKEWKLVENYSWGNK